MKKILIFLGLFVPYFTFAHTRWFAENELPPLQTTEPTGLYIGIWIAIVATVVSIGILTHTKNVLRLDFFRPKKRKSYERAASTFTMTAGAFFLIAGTHEYLFSPNLTIESGIPAILVVLQILIGIAFLLGIGTRTSALILAGLWFLAVPFAGLLKVVENIWILSTAAFIFLMGNDYFSIVSVSVFKKATKKFRKYALSILRIGTGATLLILGLTEKILAPEFGINFLEGHSWNFMQSLGFKFSDYLFTISAGSVEFLLGLVFVLGIMPRINALVVAVIFSIPLFILGPIELAGHLPHFAAVVLILLFGNGGHLIPFKTKKDLKESPI
jgi:uncharacterized membrane protein YphA (DoxX/SURF4 family)